LASQRDATKCVVGSAVAVASASAATHVFVAVGEIAAVLAVQEDAWGVWRTLLLRGGRGRGRARGTSKKL